MGINRAGSTEPNQRGGEGEPFRILVVCNGSSIHQLLSFSVSTNFEIYRMI